MILKCPNCETCYETTAEIPDDGRKVRCAECGTVWTAKNDEEIQVDEDISLDESEGLSTDDAVAEEETEDEEVDAFAQDENESDAEEDPVNLFDDEFLEEQTIEEEPTEEISAVDDEAEEIPGGLDAFDDNGLVDDTEDDSQFFGASETATENNDAVEEELTDTEENIPIAVNSVELREEEPEETVPEVKNSEKKYQLPFLDKLNFRYQPLDKKTVISWSGFTMAIFAFFFLSYVLRVSIVSLLPTSANIYAQFGVDVNIRGLEFKGIQYKKVEDTEAPQLEITGEIVNITSSQVKVPTIVFAFRDEDGDELYHWATRIKVDRLPGNRKLPFSFKVPKPPKLVHSVELRFAKAQ